MKTTTIGLMLMLASAIAFAQSASLKTVQPAGFDAPVTVEARFVHYLEDLGKDALKNRIQISPTHSFRKWDQDLSHPVVAPAAYSNHLVGNAIDANLVLDDVIYTSDKLREVFEDDDVPPAIRTVIVDWCKDSSLRWGGNFSSEIDYVHFDRDLVHTDKRAYVALFNDLQDIDFEAYRALLQRKKELAQSHQLQQELNFLNELIRVLE